MAGGMFASHCVNGEDVIKENDKKKILWSVFFIGDEKHSVSAAEYRRQSCYRGMIRGTVNSI